MAEQDRWTPADDSLVRSALSGLRSEVDRVPLPGAAEIRAGGPARPGPWYRRPAAAWLSGVAAAAAVFGVVYLASRPPAAQGPMQAPSATATMTRSHATVLPTPVEPPQGVFPSHSIIPGPLDKTSPSSRPATDPTVRPPRPSDPRPIGDVTVAGPPGRTPPPDLFLTQAQWASRALTPSGSARSLIPDFEGGSDMFDCDPDPARYPVGGGRFGITVIADAGSGRVVGRQRIRSLEPTRTELGPLVEAYLAAMRSGIGEQCPFGNGIVRATAGPSPWTAKRVTSFDDGSPALTEYVGVAATGTPGHVATLTLLPVGGDATAFAELDRLLSLVRAR